MSVKNNKPVDRKTKNFAVGIFNTNTVNKTHINNQLSATLATAHANHYLMGAVLPVADSIERAVNWYLAERHLSLKDIIYQTVYWDNNSLSASPFYYPTDVACIGIIYHTRSDIQQAFGVNQILPIVERQVQERQNAELAQVNHWLNKMCCTTVSDNDVDSVCDSNCEQSNPIDDSKTIITQKKWFDVRYYLHRLKQFFTINLSALYQTV